MTAVEFMEDSILLNIQANFGQITNGRKTAVLVYVLIHPKGMDIHSYGLNRNSKAWDYLTSEELIELLVRTVCQYFFDTDKIGCFWRESVT